MLILLALFLPCELKNKIWSQSFLQVLTPEEKNEMKWWKDVDYA